MTVLPLTLSTVALTPRPENVPPPPLKLPAPPAAAPKAANPPAERRAEKLREVNGVAAELAPWRCPYQAPADALVTTSRKIASTPVVLLVHL